MICSRALRLRSSFTFKVKIWRHHGNILSTSGGTSNGMSTPNSANKRRARVQGGWAAPTNVRSDRDKPKVPAGPAWLGKNVDQPVERKFVYEKPEEVIWSVCVFEFEVTSTESLIHLRCFIHCYPIKKNLRWINSKKKYSFNYVKII